MEHVLRKLAIALAETKFRLVSQGDLLIMKVMSLSEDTSASHIVLHMTMAQSRVMALSQVSPILKTLQDCQLIVSKESSSSQTGRPMVVYSLTKKGKRALELGEELISLCHKK